MSQPTQIEGGTEYNIIVLSGEDEGVLWGLQPYSVWDKYPWANINHDEPDLWDVVNGFSKRGWRTVSVGNIKNCIDDKDGLRVVMEKACDKTG